jgi:hypothetical protein
VGSSDAASTRHLIEALLLRFVTDHVATADAATARFVIGRTERPSDLARALRERTDRAARRTGGAQVLEPDPTGTRARAGGRP